MSQRFSYVRYDELRAQKQATFREAFEALEHLIMSSMPPGRPQSLCLTALEEAYMWTGKALRDEQILVDGQVIEEANRGEEGTNVDPKPVPPTVFEAEALNAMPSTDPYTDGIADAINAINGKSSKGYALHVVRKAPGKIDGHGLELLAVSIVEKGTATPIRTFHVFSGAPGKQVFQKGGSVNVPRSLMPCPQGKYTVGKEEWAQGRKDDFDASWGPGLGPCFIAFDPTFPTRRGDFGIHLDENHASAPGSAGCLVFETRAHFKEFLAAFREYKPTSMTVDWGLS